MSGSIYVIQDVHSPDQAYITMLPVVSTVEAFHLAETVNMTGLVALLIVISLLPVVYAIHLD